MYGYTTAEYLGGNLIPPMPRRFEGLDDAKAQLEAEAREFFKIESRPLVMWLYEGEPAGDEQDYGYPDYPDHVLRAECNDFETDILITEEVV